MPGDRGSAVVELLVSTAQAEREVAAFIKQQRQMAVSVTADTTKLAKSVDDGLAAFRTHGKVTVPFDVDTAQVALSMQKLDAVTKQTRRFTVEADLTKAEANLKRWADDGGKAMTEMQAKMARLDEIQLKTKQVRLNVDLADAERQFKKLGDAAEAELGAKLDKISGKMTSLGKTASIAVTAPVMAAYGLALKSASDLGERVNATNVLFGEGASVIHAYAATAATAFGQSKMEAEEMAGGFANMLRQTGVGQEQLAQMSVQMAQRASDIGSFLNKSNEEVKTALMSGLAGETESIRRLGIVLDAAQVKQLAYKMGIAEVGKELTSGQKVLATFYGAMKQSDLMAGDFGNTLGNSMPNQLKASKAELSNISAELGVKLIPFMKFGLVGARDLLRSFAGWPPELQTVAMALAAVAAAGGPVLIFGGKAIDGFNNLSHALRAHNTLLRDGTGALTAFGGAMKALGTAAIVATAIFAVASALDRIQKSNADKKVNAITDALSKGTAEDMAKQVDKIATAFHQMEEAVPETLKLPDYDASSLKSIDAAFDSINKKGFSNGGAFLVGGAMGEVEALRKALDHLIDKGQIDDANKLIDALAKAGVPAEVIQLLRDKIAATVKSLADSAVQSDNWAAKIEDAKSVAGQMAPTVDTVSAALLAQTDAASRAAAMTASYGSVVAAWKDVADKAFSGQFSFPKVAADDIVRQEAYSKSLQDIVDKQKGGVVYEKDLGDLRSKSTSATTARVAAERDLASVADSSAKNTRQLASADKELADLRKQVKDSTNGISAAYREYEKAGLAVHSADRNIEKAEQGVQKAKADHKSAQDDLSKAETEYGVILETNTRKLGGYGATSDEAAKSKRELTSAELGLAEATAAGGEAGRKLAEAQEAQASSGKSTSEYAKAEADAKTRQAQADKDLEGAEKALTSAKKASDQASKGITEAEKGVTAARKASEQATKGIAEAEKGVVAARRNAEQAAKGIIDAEKGVAAARKSADQAAKGIGVAEKGVVTARENAVKATLAIGAAEQATVAARAVAVSAADELAQAESRLAAVISGAGAASEAGIAATRALSAAQRSARSAALDTADAQGALADAQAALAAGGADPNAAAKEAQARAQFDQQAAQAAKAVAQAQQQIVSAQKQLTTAQAAGAAAAQNLANVEAGVNRVLTGYAIGTREAILATRDLARAQRSGQSAQLDLLDSQDALVEAQQRYDALGSVASSVEREKSFRALQRAQLALADAQDKGVTSQEAASDQAAKTNEVLHGAVAGSDSYAAAIASLTAAQDSFAQANQAIADSSASVADAMTAEAEAIAATNIQYQPQVTANVFNRAAAEEAVERAQLAVAAATDKALDADKAAAEQAVKTGEIIDGAVEGSAAYAAAQDAVTAAKEKVVAAADGVTSAEQRTADARTAAQAATEAITTAEDGVVTARENAQTATDAIGEAEARVVDARYNAAQATEAIGEAEAKVGEAREKAIEAAAAIGEAEAKVVEARAAAVDATKAVTDAEGDLLAAQEKQKTAGIIEWTWDQEKATRAVASASLDLEKAQLAVTEAAAKVTEAQKAYNEIVYGVPPSSEAGRKLRGEIETANDKRVAAGEKVKGFEGALGAIQEAILGKEEAIRAKKDAVVALADALKKKTGELPALLDKVKDKEADIAEIKAQSSKGDDERQSKVEALAKAREAEKTAAGGLKKFIDDASDATKLQAEHTKNISAAWDEVAARVETARLKAEKDGDTSFSLLKAQQTAAADVAAENTVKGLSYVSKVLNETARTWVDRATIPVTINAPDDIEQSGKNMAERYRVAALHDFDSKTAKDAMAAALKGLTTFDLPVIEQNIKILAETKAGKDKVEEFKKYLGGIADNPVAAKILGDITAAQGSVSVLIRQIDKDYVNKKWESKLESNRASAKKSVEDQVKQTQTDWVSGGGRGGFNAMLSADPAPAKKTVEDARDHANAEWTNKDKTGKLEADRSKAKADVDAQAKHALDEWTTKDKTGKLEADRSSAKTAVVDQAKHAKDEWTDKDKTGKLEGDRSGAKTAVTDQAKHALDEWTNKDKTGKIEADRSKAKSEVEAARDHAVTEWTGKDKTGKIEADRSKAKTEVEAARDHAQTEWTGKEKEGKLTADKLDATTKTDAADNYAKQNWHNIQYTGLLRGKSDEPGVGAVAQSSAAKSAAEGYSGVGDTKSYTASLKATDNASSVATTVKGAVDPIEGTRTATLKAQGAANSQGELPAAAATTVSNAINGVKDHTANILLEAGSAKTAAGEFGRYVDALVQWTVHYQTWLSDPNNTKYTGSVLPVFGEQKPNPANFHFAGGGLFDNPLYALIGEAGAELLLPLTRPASAAHWLGRAAQEHPEQLSQVLVAAGASGAMAHQLLRLFRSRSGSSTVDVLGGMLPSMDLSGTGGITTPAPQPPGAGRSVGQVHIHTALTDVSQVADVVMERIERPLLGLQVS